MIGIILEMKGIIKIFFGVKVLENVNFKIWEGEIYFLCGENGVGKFILMKVFSGVYLYGMYEGDILFQGKICEFKSIKQSEDLGIVIIYQEFVLIFYLFIVENIYLGNECVSKGIIDWKEILVGICELFFKVGLSENLNIFVFNIGVGKQQLVEIVKVFFKKVCLFILDELMVVLNEDDSENLF